VVTKESVEKESPLSVDGLLCRARVDGSRLVSALLSLADDVESDSSDEGEDDEAEGKGTQDDPGDVPTAES